MLENIIKNHTYETNSIQEQINELQQRQLAVNYIEKRSKEIWKILEPALEKMKMDITKFNLSYSLENFVIGESRISFSTSMKPTSKSYRFISFKGYTKEGRGRNHNQLVNKAEKFDSKFDELLNGEARCASNLFSFEDNNTTYGSSKNYSNSILAEISFK